jgi:hypothetical protein
MTPDHNQTEDPQNVLPEEIPCEPRSERLKLRALQRESERRANMAWVPKVGATRWQDRRGQRYERLKNGQIVRVSE